MTAEEVEIEIEIERGLTDKHWNVRWGWAKFTDFTPTPEQIERGLNDVDSDVRWAFAQRTDFVPTPAQVERGLKDIAGEVRWVFEERQHEWRARWEAEELKQRHASIVTSNTKLVAL